MKKLLTLSCFVLFGASMHAYGQALFNTVDSINVNNINAAVLVHGDMWWNPETVEYRCLFPNGSRKNINFIGSVWMSGYDAGSNLHIAAQTYRQSGNDYWPGPLDAADTITYATSQQWAKIWKVTAADVGNYLSQTSHTLGNIPVSILSWPGKGNANAIGNGGVPLTVTTDMAPFVDLNSNGIYEPLQGEYPDFRGEEALWWIFNDNGPTHTQSRGKPLGVEVHAMAYAYSRNTLIDNVVYYEYTAVNKSANDYTDFRLALWDNIDLGYYLDDFLGYDSVHRMGIAYNGNNDDGLIGGHPYNTYGLNPPMTGMTLISLPGDAGSSYVPAGSFTNYYIDYLTPDSTGYPEACNNLMRSKNWHGDHLTRDWSDTGYIPPGTGPDCNYFCTGDPGDHTQWSECAMNNTAGDRVFMLASNDFTLPAGSSRKILMAQVVADTTGGCGATNFDAIKIVADTAWAVYQNPPPPKPLAIYDPAARLLHIYPNPADDKLYIDHPGNNTGSIQVAVYNTLGQLMPVHMEAGRSVDMLDIQALPPGMYHVVYTQGGECSAGSFVKQ